MRPDMKDVFTRMTWQEFRDSGALWFVNTLLHVLGIALVFQEQDDGTAVVYPTRTVFRGFGKDAQDRGFKNLHRYLAENIETIQEETNE